ncbi:transcription termination/antitermination protein NusG [Gloeobacter violaceus]|uniref:Transcription termination/antitermination protein NusG n=1 Tax=Gloeobacter violaceus (strain ATCC 29082 / PCC 7421) TaxID=251221 RepID=Q7NMD6_GLOVI|nr:transcription antitermination protein [Gloeobacter violaceus PCC 7421]
MVIGTDFLMDSARKPEQPEPHWYFVQVASGCEKKVKTNLEQRIQTMEMSERILKVEIPERQAVRIRQEGSRTASAEKIFPGYVLINMVMDDESWQVVKNTPNVINFVGTEERRRYGRGRGHVTPRPLGSAEVNRIFRAAEQEEPVIKVDLEPGHKIEVTAGPFQDFNGEVVEVNPERGTLKALISIFGRDTPVELGFNQVRRLDE